MRAARPDQSLVAMMIGDIGEEATERVVRSWVANLAAEPFSSDTLMLNAIAAGQCDVGISNSYYLGRLQAEKPGFPVQIFWADQQGAGTHRHHQFARLVADDAGQRPGVEQLALQRLAVEVFAAAATDAQRGAVGSGGAHAFGDVLQS